MGTAPSHKLEMQTKEKGREGRERANNQHSSCFLILRGMGVPSLGVCYHGLCHAFPAIMNCTLLISEPKQIFQPLSCFCQVSINSDEK